MSDDAGVKPIETVYNGYKFRSRLEARWAVFFDTLAIPYEYEPEGFDLGDEGWYLPDFWLPEQRCWIEIKQSEPTDDEQDKMSALVGAAAVGRLGEQFRAERGYIFFGPTPHPSPWEQPGTYQSAYGLLSYVEEADDGPKTFVGWDLDHWWCECPRCGSLDIQYSGRAERNACGCYGAAEDAPHISGADSDRLEAAYAKARQAQFEHGARL